MAVDQNVEYEWRPILCSKCSSYGHENTECRNTAGKLRWFRKLVVQPDKNSFVTVGKTSNVIMQDTTIIIVHNSFTALQNTDDDNHDSSGVIAEHGIYDKETGAADDKEGDQTGDKGLGWLPHSQMDRILVCNVRGINNGVKMNEVMQFISSYDIKLFSLLETRVKTPKLGHVYTSLCPWWCFTHNDSFHKNGRIIFG